MSTRCYDTYLNDLDRPVPAGSPAGVGGPRTTDLRAVLNAIFYLLRTGCQWRLCYPASSRARAPFTITFVPGKMRARPMKIEWARPNHATNARRQVFRFL